MATTGGKLVELSGLPLGTALEHLLAITTGGGTGETVLVLVDSIRANVIPDLSASLEAGVTADVAGDIIATVDDESIAAATGDEIQGELNR